MRIRKAFSLLELIIVVAIIGVLSVIAVPRLQHAAIRRQKAQAVAQKIVTDMRRARSLAILHAADNTNGYALNMFGAAPYVSYRIVNLKDSSIVDSLTIGSGVSCTGGDQFEFGPLGNLKTGSDTQLVVSAQGKTCTVTITAATGMIKCVEN